MAANNKLIILMLLICLLPHIIFSSASAQELDTKAYVDSWCQDTKYPNLCVRSLSPVVRSLAIQSPQELVLFLLKESLNTTAFLLKEVANPKPPNLQDKVLAKQLRLTVTRLEVSLRRMIGIITKLLLRGNGVGGVYFSLKRWTSEALADAETLMSVFQGRGLSKSEATIYGKVKNVHETVSNALAIVQHYVNTRH
ncbi:unnamed protein product [Eruca vesicaria subsp. sativa]|uniref:Pectinesterase inhibitor domain-containing protein n=1 Tax=Eruca vesicaria subsp. sativa TaxID=29727 RepID=A0ABC8JND0_ERUVS|nr:unnamed protein product [Eruca vesicaria subsp. sativa]